MITESFPYYLVQNKFQTRKILIKFMHCIHNLPESNFFCNFSFNKLNDYNECKISYQQISKYKTDVQENVLTYDVDFIKAKLTCGYEILLEYFD